MSANQSVEHTPGPWTVEKAHDGFEYDIKSEPFCIAAIPDMPGQTQANARLVAAAPDMYAALRRIWEMLQSPDGEYVSMETIYDICSSAVLKAEGRRS